MCGVCGIIEDDRSAAIDRVLLDRMTDSLEHRGPDGRGTFIDGGVGLGHRRLSIIDLDSGDQPIYNEDRSIVVVYNGEIYNYKELRADLQSRGHQFRTQSDTEVIVHLYEQYGDDCVNHLNGMFAFVLWDTNRRRLFAARDRLGEKPLYYCCRPRRLLIGSELKTLLEDQSVPRELDLLALDDYLAYGYVPAPRTIFQGVWKLAPAHCLVWDQGRVTTRRYWSISFPDRPRRSEEDYVEELRELLHDAIRLRLRSDVPVAAFLSGGMDSNLVVAMASQLLERPMQTFSVGFGETDYNELHLARLTASRYHTDHHEIIVDDANVSVLPELVEHYDEPFADPSMIPTFYIAREASRFVKVCLTGDGGDEVFAGYPQYVDALRYAKVNQIPACVRRAVLGSVAALLPDHVRGKGLMRRLSVSAASRYQRQVGVLDVHERRALLQPDIARSVCRDAALFEEHFAGNHLDVVSRCQKVDQNTYLPEDILVKLDRATMKNSLEGRIPLLDHRLVELVNAMPSDMKIRGGTQKYILRRLADGVVPPEIIAGPKRGFGIPLKYWLRGDLKSFARDLLLSSRSRSDRFLQRRAVERLLDSHDRQGRDLSDRIWALLVLEQWCRCFNM